MLEHALHNSEQIIDYRSDYTIFLGEACTQARAPCAYMSLEISSLRENRGRGKFSLPHISTKSGMATLAVNVISMMSFLNLVLFPGDQ